MTPEIDANGSGGPSEGRAQANSEPTKEVTTINDCLVRQGCIGVYHHFAPMLSRASRGRAMLLR